MMRIAVFSDVHGNPFACRAVLDAIAADGAFDAVVNAGDICSNGSGPAACVDMLREAGVWTVYGNNDQYIVWPDVLPKDDLHMRMWHDKIVPHLAWQREQLGAERIAWLARLPFDLRFSPTVNPDDDLLVVHANPKNIETMIYPAPEAQIAQWGEVVQPDDDPELAEVMAGTRAAVVAFGHLHLSHERQWGGMRLVDVAPASLALIDGDWRARYTVFEWVGDRWDVQRRFVDYDVAFEAEALRASDMPHKNEIVAWYT